MMKQWICFFTLALLLGLTGCTRRKTLWIYTSLPREVISEMAEPLRTAVPESDIKWYQSTSEAVSTRLTGEISKGNNKADLLVTADPFTYLELKQTGKLFPYVSPAAKDVPPNYVDSEHMFSAIRIAAMVVGYNSDLVKAADLPERWKDLTQAKWKNKVSMGSPLESAMNFTMLGMLSTSFGWEYFSELRKNEIVSEGSSASVMNRMESGERPIGIVMLENIAKAKGRGSPIRVIYPQDGIIPIPGPIAILKDTENLAVAKKIYDWFYSTAAQNALIRGGWYSPLPGMPSPEGAKPWAELAPHAMPWNSQIAMTIFRTRDQIKAKFSEIVLH